MDYYSLAIKRESTRSYKKRPLTDKELSEIKTYLPACKRLIPELELEMKILGPEAFTILPGCAGYHDYMIEAPHYLLLLTSKGEHSLVNAGYAAEDLVLKLTEMEVDTCWITITDGEELKKRMGIESDKEAAALIAFGDRAKIFPGSRLDIKSPSDVQIKQRNGFIAPKLAVDSAVFDQTWGTGSDISSLPTNSSVYQAFIAACCSPTYLNLQPYRFIMDGDHVVLVCLNDGQTDDADAKLNAGIVMLHFAGVMSEHQNETSRTGWKLGAPEKHYDIPENGWIAGYYQN